MTSTIVLGSGVNRGLGKGLVELYLAKPNHSVIAANRDPESASSKALAKLPTGSDSRLIVIKTDASVETDALEAVKTLSSHGIDHIDIVMPTLESLTPGLKNQPPIPNAAYGTSKAAVHWLTKRINAEEKLTAFVISPGWCKTELGNAGARHFGMAEAIVEPADSCRGMVELIDVATKESHGGKLWDVQDGLLVW
ncbi:hypothetical protein IFR05_005806 [Cadophora sp. M221]|nr:hypothetical protein IFR05_005806 [Cadophora sp. M221]